MNKIIFRGAGCNGSSLLTAITNAFNTPSKETVPPGATWPFVMLSIDEQTIRFSMAHIQRTVTPSDVIEVRLDKLGYLFFRTRDRGHEFGFATLKMPSLIEQLRERGYHLDESCKSNMLIARISLTLLTVIPLAFLAVIITMIILKPNGV